MTKTKAIRFAEMRHLLTNLGYKEKHVENACVFFRSEEDMIIFRRYADQDSLRSGDVESTRQFLDLRGVINEDKFDAFFERATTSA